MFIVGKRNFFIAVNCVLGLPNGVFLQSFFSYRFNCVSYLLSVHFVARLTSFQFYAGLFGEHILSTLSHAWKNLLHPSRGVVIPGKADMFCCIIEAEDIRKHHR